MEAQKGKAFMTVFKKRSGVVVTPAGAAFRVIKQGSGSRPSAKSLVRVHYEGRTVDGLVFDSSRGPGRGPRADPTSFPLDRVIPCWSDVIPRLTIGSKAQVVCPAKLAYGDRGAPPAIPPGATLVFEIDLVGRKSMKLMRIKKRALIGLVWTCLLFGGGAMGVVLKPLSLNEMLERATNVTISEVSEMKSFWQEGRILTWVTVRATTTFKGSTGTLRILVPGGTVGNLTQHIPGGPQFAIGEVNLLFLEPMDTSSRLVGFTRKCSRYNGTQNRFHRWVAKLTHSDVGTSAVDERTRVGTLKVAVPTRSWFRMSQSASAFVRSSPSGFPISWNLNCLRSNLLLLVQKIFRYQY